MISYEKAIVKKIISSDEKRDIVELDIANTIKKAYNYKDISGNIAVGDQVVVNTTAVNLSLGTGGQHFIIYNYKNDKKDLDGSGHIMKLRYTPYQIRVLAAEEETSPYHDKFLNFKSLDGHLCIVGSLHSMLAPIASSLKYLNPNLSINYIMTDAGALPIEFSNTVRELKEKSIINKTITIGHAFGGDLETVNIYNGLIASKEIFKSDVTIITMGPGIVGTGTKYGFSGIDQGINLDAVSLLGGLAIGVPRISFKDSRIRHRGISHQSITSLGEVARTSSNIVLPLLEGDKQEVISGQIESSLLSRHNIIYRDGDLVKMAMEKYGLKTSTMGRGLMEDEEFFLGLGAVASYANELLK